MYFKKALPIWPEGHSKEMNSQATFRTTVPDLTGTSLYITAATYFQLFVNGKFVHYGPARTAKAHARVDVLELGKYNKENGNEIVIHVAGYYNNCLSLVRMPSFLRAELRDSNDNVIVATGEHAFKAFIRNTRVQKVMRYSRQRNFSEVYDFAQVDMPCKVEAVNYPTTLLPRRSPMPLYEEFKLDEAATYGKYEYDEKAKIRKSPYNDKEILRGPLGGFLYEEMEYLPYQYIQKCKIKMSGDSAKLPTSLSAGEYVVLDYKQVQAGFFKNFMEATEDSEVILVHSEYSDAEYFVPQRQTSLNTIEYILPAGKEYELLSFEPYVFRYVIIAVKKGSIKLNYAGFVSFEYPDVGLREEKFDDPELDLIWNAAKRSFIHNAVDIYMDCPSRERAGWLCDSYFTGKSEYYFTGKTLVEDDFVENFVLRPDDDPANDPEDYTRGIMPKGMIPMTYPTSDPLFIPQWAMWYVLEVDEYLRIRNREADPKKFHKIVGGLLDFLKKYENENGMLEKLPGWNFVEWSKCNDWVQDVNYPTNFLYAETLEAAGRIFGEAEAYKQRADELRAKTAELSFNGEFFVDHAIRNKETKVLENCADISETCQYYALRFGNVDLEDPKYATLKNAIYNVFGPNRADDQYPEIEKAQPFIGMYVRMETLLRLGLYDMLIDNIRGYFRYMAEETGTLWEYPIHKGSEDHGFASYAAYVMAKATGKIKD